MKKRILVPLILILLCGIFWKPIYRQILLLPYRNFSEEGGSILIFSPDYKGELKNGRACRVMHNVNVEKIIKRYKESDTFIGPCFCSGCEPYFKLVHPDSSGYNLYEYTFEDGKSVKMPFLSRFLPTSKEHSNYYTLPLKKDIQDDSLRLRLNEDGIFNTSKNIVRMSYINLLSQHINQENRDSIFKSFQKLHNYAYICNDSSIFGFSGIDIQDERGKWDKYMISSKDSLCIDSLREISNELIKANREFSMYSHFTHQGTTEDIEVKKEKFLNIHIPHILKLAKHTREVSGPIVNPYTAYFITKKEFTDDELKELFREEEK